jgi:hypothetical protein
MLRQMVVGSVMAVAALVGSASTGHAEVGLDLGVHLGSPPQFAPVPESPVSYAPSVGANLFMYGGELFNFRGGVWFAAPGYQGPWSEVRPEYVPRPILAVPVRYYHERPREWAQWRHEAAPRWGSTWGRRWEDRRPEHPAAYRDEHRGERHVAYRDEHRGERQPSYRDEHRDGHHGDRVPAYRDEHRNGRYDDRR